MLSELLRKKIDDSFKESFVGNSVILSEAEKSELIEEVGYMLRNVAYFRGESLLLYQYRAVALALVELTRNWNSDDDSWLDYISKKLIGRSGEIKGKVYSNITKCFDTLDNAGLFFLLECFRKKYYASVCCHAFAPKSSVFAFFDICWEIYCNDLSQQYTHNDPILDLIVTNLRKKFYSSNSEDDGMEFTIMSSIFDNDDDVSIGSNAYSLRVGIKGLAIDQQDLLSELLDITLTSIDSLFYNEPISADTHYKQLINEWWLIKQKTFGVRRERIRSRERELIASEYSQIRAKYILENGRARLIVPSFRLRGNYHYEPYIEVVVNGDTSFEKQIPTRGSVVLTTECESFDLDSLNIDGAIDISIVIRHAGEIIYTSKETLNRDFILFSGNREVTSQSLLPDTYFLYTTKINSLKIPQDVKSKSKNLFSIFAHEGDYISSLNKTVFFETTKTGKSAFFSSNEIQNATFRKNGTLYKLIDGDIYLSADSDCNFVDIGVRLNDRVYKLQEFNSTSLDRRTRFNLSELAEPGEPIELTVFRYSDYSIIDATEIVKFTNITVSFDKELYYGRNELGEVDFKSDQIDVKVTFFIDSEDCSIPYAGGDIIISPPVLKWRLTGQEWHINPSKTIYYKELSNSSILEIEIPKGLEYNVCMTNGGYLVQGTKRDQFLIGQKLHSQYKPSWEDTVVFVRHDDKFYEICQVFLKQVFLDEPIAVESDSKTIAINTTLFVGDKDTQLTVKLLNSEDTVVWSNILMKNQLSTFCLSDLRDDYYQIRIDSKLKGPFSKNETMYEKMILLGDIRRVRFNGKALKVNFAVLHNAAKPLLMRSTLYIYKLRFLGTRDGADYYSGQLYLTGRDGKRVPVNYAPNQHTGEKVRINPLRIELKTLSSCYLGYGLHANDPEFEYEDEFALTEKNQIYFGADRNLKAIDYYVFELIDEE